MKKIVGFITVLTVFSWVTTANAGPLVVDIQSSSGVLTIDGFANPSPQNLNFLFNFADGNSGQDSGIVNVLQEVYIGQDYHVHLGFGITSLAQSFSADFDIVSLQHFDPGYATVDNILGGIISGGGATSFTPSNGFLTVNGDTLQLLSVVVDGSITDPTLLLRTRVITGNTLTGFLNLLDGAFSQPVDGIVASGFTAAHAEVSVPEPTAFVLLSSGLLGMFGFSKKRA